MNKLIILFATVLILGGCASAGNQSLKAETEATMSQKLKEGQTTKAEVRSMFGSPLETSFTDGGAEIWKYQLDDVSADAVNFIPIVNLFGSSYSGTRKELVIMFDQNDIIKRFSMSESDVDTKGGLFK